MEKVRESVHGWRGPMRDGPVPWGKCGMVLAVEASGDQICKSNSELGSSELEGN